MCSRCWLLIQFTTCPFSQGRRRRTNKRLTSNEQCATCGENEQQHHHETLSFVQLLLFGEKFLGFEVASSAQAGEQPALVDSLCQLAIQMPKCTVWHCNFNQLLPQWQCALCVLVCSCFFLTAVVSGRQLAKLPGLSEVKRSISTALYAIQFS